MSDETTARYEVDAAWRTEIGRRLDEVLNGDVEFTDAAEHSARLRAKHDAVEEAVKHVEAGTAQLSRDSRQLFLLGDQTIRAVEVLEFFLRTQTAAGLDAKRAAAFADRMRVLLGWGAVSPRLRCWFETTVRDQFFRETKLSSWESTWALRRDADPSLVNPQWLEFGCWIAVSYMKYDYIGQHFAKEILEQVAALGSRLPAELKKHGTGSLPLEVTSYRDASVTATANDAFGTIRIVIKEESEGHYRTVLSWLCRLLQQNFPRSYAIDFRSPDANWLPVKGIPRKGVHRLFANAVRYPGLWLLIEQYARVAMREWEWYTNISREDPALPGTFAVFALTLADDAYVPLALDYLAMVDGEHQAMHGRLIHSYIAAHGFTRNAIDLLLACAGNIQELAPVKSYPAMIANQDSLTALVEARAAIIARRASAIRELRQAGLDHLLDVPDYGWQTMIHGIWGQDGINDPERIIARAPEEFRSLYEEILLPIR